MRVFARFTSRNSEAVKRLAEEIEVLHNSLLVDPVWYRQTYSDLRDTPIDVARHYLEYGAREGRNPGPLFDTKFYLKHNPDVAATGVNPLVHYLTIGWRSGCQPNRFFDPNWYSINNSHLQVANWEPLTHYAQSGWLLGLDPHPEFDSEFYSKTYLDVIASGKSPLVHFLEVGAAQGRMPRSGWKTDTHSRTTASAQTVIHGGTFDECRDSIHSAPVQLTFTLSRAPLVTIIATNMNGSRHLPDLFASLDAQTYRNFEIVFVDDNSNDGSVEVAARLGAHKVVRTSEVVGFARANNLGLAKSEGELIALLNNDTRVDPGWLEAMVTEIRRDPRICAVAPKIRFWTKFQRIDLTAPEDFSVDRTSLVRSLTYQKMFVRRGEEGETTIRSVREGARSTIQVDLPVQDEPFSLIFESSAAQIVAIRVDSISKRLAISERATSHSFSLSESNKRAGFHLLNNVGSMELQPFKPSDRGFGEVDLGQYDKEVDVDLLCGCSALIRRDALHGRKLFIDEFIAYYEDSELSRRLRNAGYIIRYAPSSVVYHRHSATNVEKSLFWRINTARNAILFEYLFADAPRKKECIDNGKGALNHLMVYFRNSVTATRTEKEFAEAVPWIMESIDQIRVLIDGGAVPGRQSPRVGVYNSFWNTLGGGEARALDIAEFLSSYGQVELISEEDFDIDYLCEYFNVGLSNARKRIVRFIDTSVTAEYDLFVNCRYQSGLVSAAKQSLFVVSFPSRTASPEFLKSYHFLANSEFTLRWMKRYWGADRFSGEVLYPAVARTLIVDKTKTPLAKKKLILSVGRFATDGHTKNQLEIALAFRQLCEGDADIARDWKLALVGSASDDRYVSLIKSVLEDVNAEIVLNADFTFVRDLYRDAAIYVHASGLGRDPQEEPERLEHFGITVAQAVGSGCMPIVYAGAGPEEIVRTIGLGYVYHSVDDLGSTLASAMRMFDSPDDWNRMVAALVERSEIYSTRRQKAELQSIFDRVIRSKLFAKDIQ
jgi:GT2 family glycosyltransferase/glycosyltransferase involved in cell wall biosynthesis